MKKIYGHCMHIVKFSDCMSTQEQEMPGAIDIRGCHVRVHVTV